MTSSRWRFLFYPCRGVWWMCGTDNMCALAVSSNMYVQSIVRFYLMSTVDDGWLHAMCLFVPSSSSLLCGTYRRVLTNLPQWGTCDRLSYQIKPFTVYCDMLRHGNRKNLKTNYRPTWFPSSSTLLGVAFFNYKFYHRTRPRPSGQAMQWCT